MAHFCIQRGGAIEGGKRQNYGYVIESERYRYLLRCIPAPGDYNAFITCFDKRMQEMSQAKQKAEQQPTIVEPPQQGMTMEGMSLGSVHGS